MLNNPVGICIEGISSWIRVFFFLIVVVVVVLVSHVGEDIYVADYGNNRIRKIDKYGHMSTLAGMMSARFGAGDSSHVKGVKKA
jgi:hypothetical protein